MTPKMTRSKLSKACPRSCGAPPGPSQARKPSHRGESPVAPANSAARRCRPVFLYLFPRLGLRPHRRRRRHRNHHRPPHLHITTQVLLTILPAPSSTDIVIPPWALSHLHAPADPRDAGSGTRAGSEGVGRSAAHIMDPCRVFTVRRCARSPRIFRCRCHHYG